MSVKVVLKFEPLRSEGKMSNYIWQQGPWYLEAYKAEPFDLTHSGYYFSLALRGEIIRNGRMGSISQIEQSIEKYINDRINYYK